MKCLALVFASAALVLAPALGLQDAQADQQRARRAASRSGHVQSGQRSTAARSGRARAVPRSARPTRSNTPSRARAVRPSSARRGGQATVGRTQRRSAEPSRRAPAPRRAQAPRRAEAPRRAQARRRAEAPRRAQAPRRAEAPRRAQAARRVDRTQPVQTPRGRARVRVPDSTRDRSGRRTVGRAVPRQRGDVPGRLAVRPSPRGGKVRTAPRGRVYTNRPYRGSPGYAARHRPYRYQRHGRYGYGYPAYRYSYPSYGYFSYDYGYGYGPRYRLGVGYAPAPYGDLGSLRLKIRPRDAHVFVDGYYVGLVDEFDGVFQRLRLEPGPHRIEVEAEGYAPLVFDVRIVPGETITYEEYLQPAPLP